LFWNRTVRHKPAVVGAQTLIGREAVVLSPCRPEGQVRLDGEIWQARCGAGADPGDTVRVVGRGGLPLVVAPAGGPAGGGTQRAPANDPSATSMIHVEPFSRATGPVSGTARSVSSSSTFSMMSPCVLSATGPAAAAFSISSIVASVDAPSASASELSTGWE